ncbi:aminotransferase class I [Citrobacter amalonaticus]|uniref:Aminotransferase class I n=1 Tax=Citrobacter amalonaticus TaxID=35703 RepID=A0A2S4S1B2_CITAM|nr:histidinol-phosphate transaminase [Citrobacter amalonaticus]POT55197.1 aminotransferase class I [Citrobacter amalonaticus]POT77195.1 aminotransferase class I [Citrobacter amalonaticus]POU67646.1 aminotransferase class I [Citrobacter amalonaticus]POV07251.1 aminotransferase class I [Citrobacter amalonaticus]
MDRRTLLKSSGLLLGGLTLGRFLTGTANASQAQTIATTGSVTPLSPPGESHPLLLNFNENAAGMSPAARQAIVDALSQMNRYPDAARETLIGKIAHQHQVEPGQISLGNGSSESIQASVQMAVFHAQKAGKAAQVVVPDPTFNYAELYAASLGVNVVKVALTDKLEFDIASLKQAVARFDGVSVVYLCNPNNPTATITSSSQLASWVTSASGDTWFIMDEAYAEFVTHPDFKSAVDLVKQGHKNVIVTRTFSKIYALAGLRIGYAVAHADTLADIEAFMSLDNTNMAGAIAAIASLEDREFLANSLSSTNTARKIVTDALDELKLEYLPSQANFIFHKVPGEVKTYQQRMKEHHVFVGREFPPAVGWNRLTLGTPQEMMQFVIVLKMFREKGWV